jgi:hypothetical protein
MRRRGEAQAAARWALLLVLIAGSRDSTQAAPRSDAATQDTHTHTARARTHTERMHAPAFMSCRMTSVWPFCAAKCKAFMSSMAAALKLAPCATSSLTASCAGPCAWRCVRQHKGGGREQSPRHGLQVTRAQLRSTRRNTTTNSSCCCCCHCRSPRQQALCVAMTQSLCGRAARSPHEQCPNTPRTNARARRDTSVLPGAMISTRAWQPHSTHHTAGAGTVLPGWRQRGQVAAAVQTQPCALLQLPRITRKRCTFAQVAYTHVLRDALQLAPGSS